MDITYIPMKTGFMYLAAVDWYSRYVLAWELSNTLEGFFCIAALEQALEIALPEMFNTDQGSQSTREAFTGVLLKNGIAITWIVAGGRWTMCLLSGCGGPSSMKRCIRRIIAMVAPASGIDPLLRILQHSTPLPEQAEYE
jgi:hypothetical protein